MKCNHHCCFCSFRICRCGVFWNGGFKWGRTKWVGERTLMPSCGPHVIKFNREN
ncbi:hypothetical protein HanRHA438_Chr15g0711531 [Helianthus annuus]|nr:hypothetical protein HanIR_Chr15g0760381 [Helianthus annuus]KAJ0845254.1 hypothetical protein HanRHA438_Chr15g0711531 [Helianthus annuus]